MPHTDFIHRAIASKQRRLLLCFAVACLSLWAFLWVAAEFRETEHVSLEARILRSFRRPEDLSKLAGPDWLEPVVRGVSEAGGVSATVLITTFATVILVLKNQRSTAGYLILAIAGGSALNWTLKHFFNRTRPMVVPYLTELSGTSFPSGHSMTTAIVYITLATLVARSLANWKAQAGIMSLGLLISCAVGLSRVMLGVHYPTDVLAGWAAGAFWALICLIAADLTIYRRKIL